MNKILFLMLLTGCGVVSPGHVGVLVHNFGGKAGVDSEVVGIGYHWTGFTTSLYEYPTFTQNHIWTKSPTEGSKEDDSFTFQTKEGLEINTDVGITYAIDGEKATTLFQKYRMGVDEITSKVLRNAVRDALNNYASKMNVDEVYGAKKMELFSNATNEVNEELSKNGITVQKLFLVGAMRLPAQVLAALNSKIEATQTALKVENEVAQSRAQAEKTIVEAKGIAEANRIKSQSLTQTLLQWEALQKWSGVLPLSTGGSIPFLHLEGAK